MKKLTIILLAAGLFSFPVAAQMTEGYLDIDSVHVKEGKAMEFVAIQKRFVEMNRKSGAHWTANAVVYGDSNAVSFVTNCATFAEAAQGIRMFEDAVKKAVGEVGMHKIFNDSDATLENEHEAIYRRRWDLSTNVPADMAANNKIVGAARWIRAVIIHTRPGKALDYENELRTNKAANERMNPGIPFWVSQSAAGDHPGTFRVVTLMKTLDEMDKMKTTQAIRGDSYPSYLRVVADAVESTDIVISRIVPELSNPPDDVVSVDTSFWHPKPPAATASAKNEPAK